MVLPIEPMTFKESRYKRGSEVWNVSTLYLFAKAKECPIIDIPLVAFDLSGNGFSIDNTNDFIFQCKRTLDCSLEHPIILDDYGQVADGYHRICKAILEGKETIKAIRLTEMPAYDLWED